MELAQCQSHVGQSIQLRNVAGRREHVGQRVLSPLTNQPTRINTWFVRIPEFHLTNLTLQFTIEKTEGYGCKTSAAILRISGDICGIAALISSGDPVESRSAS